MINTYENYTKDEFIGELITLKNDNLLLQQTNLLLQTELAQIKRMLFGAKSERFIPTDIHQQQLLFTEQPLVEIEVKQEEINYTRNKVTIKENKHQGRLPLPKHLLRVEHIVEPAENTEGLVCIGKEITEELEYTPGKFFVNKYIRPKYAKDKQQGTVAEQGRSILIADLPSRPIEKGIAGPGLLATILIEKYVDHLPLHRQLQRFKRENIHIAPSTIGDWVKYSCELLRPLYDTLKKQVLTSGYLMADETPIKVLDKDKEGATHQGYYWVYRAAHEKLIVFDYRQGRGREGPKEILKNYKGFLQTDGYSVYDDFDNRQDITLIHCMAHARRYFEQALDNDKQRAEWMLAQIQLLYHTERTAREQGYSYEQRLELRQTESIPVLQNIHQWLKDNVMQVLPKSTIGKAINYALARWDKLCIYTHHGHLEIDNNPVENAIRPVALGRKNYLFAGSHEAAQRAAMIYSLLATCKANGIEPYQWLKDTLAKLPDHKAYKLYELLPI
jgi:transposase